MTLTQTLAQARRNRFEGLLPNGCKYLRLDYLGSRALGRDGPQAFLVEHRPSSEVPPHFHEVDQFQVVVEGTGTLGREPVRPVTVIFTNAHTESGPLLTDTEPLLQLTLRTRHDAGAGFLPQARGRQKAAPRRRLVEWVDPLGEDALLGQFEVGLEEVIAPQDDGLGAWLVRIRAFVSWQSSAPVPNPIPNLGGRYLVVTGGSLAQGEATLPPMSCLYIPPRQTQPECWAGPGGVEVLLLQFPLER